MKAEFSGPVTTAIAAREAVERDILWVTVTCLVAGRAVDRALLPTAARHPADRRPGGPGDHHGLRGGRAGLRLPELVDGVPRVDHPRQRHQLRHRSHVALRGAPRAGARSPATPCARALAGVWRATLVASISASAAYASLMVTSFRGFYQFGVMGAAGALALLDRDLHGAAGDVDPARPPREAGRRRACPRSSFAAAGARAAQRTPGGSPSRHGPGHRGVGVRAHPLPEGPVRVRLSQAERQGQHLGGSARSSTAASTRSSAAGRRRPSCWPIRSTRSRRSARPSASRTRRRPATTSSGRSRPSTICCPARPRCSSASWS